MSTSQEPAPPAWAADMERRLSEQMADSERRLSEQIARIGRNVTVIADGQTKTAELLERIASAPVE